MAVNSLNVKASLTSFIVNDADSNLHNCTGTYSTYEILDSGETLNNVINYKFTITGLQDHIIDSVIFKVLLLTDLGELTSNKKFGLSFYKDDVLVDSQNNVLVGSELTKTLIPVEFSIFPRLLETENECTFSLLVNNNSLESCYFGIQNIIISLYDVDYSISISFSGPLTNRKVKSITATSLNILKGSESVTFSKDPTNNYNSDTDTVEGRAYFRKDGIWVDGYLYGTVITATETTKGVVKLKNTLDLDENGAIIAPIDSGVAATPLLVNAAINYLLNGGIPTADTENLGIVKLSDTFTVGEDGGIVIPTDLGVAASPQLVYNALATAKNYTDEQTNFSDDFERDDTDKKLYIKWIEITSDGEIN